MASGDDQRGRFEMLYRRDAAYVLAYVRRRASDEVAADVVAETFAVAWRRFPVIPAEPRPWLLGVARRVLANELRGVRRRAALSARVAAEPAPASTATEPPDAAIAALAELPERDQEVLRLAAWEELTAAEAATVLGCSPVAYRLRLHRARRKLASRLEADGVATRPNPASPCQSIQLTNPEEQT